MAANRKTVRQALSPAFLKQSPKREEIELFKKGLDALMCKINENELENHNKTFLKEFFNEIYCKNQFEINEYNDTKNKIRVDLAVKQKNKTFVEVLLEVKHPTKNKGEMLTKDNLNRKALYELLLYYMSERLNNNNKSLRHLVVTNLYEWFVFDAKDFYEIFYSDGTFRDTFSQYSKNQLEGDKTNYFYREIAPEMVAKVADKINFVHFDIRDYNNCDVDDDEFLALCKFFSPVHLLKRDVASDNNKLNKEFYNELLHILGLTETKAEGKIKIERKSNKNRDEGSLLELTIAQLETVDLSQIVETDNYPSLRYQTDNYPSLQFEIALSLVITWVNRILFLKLLEAQLLKYHSPSPTLPEREGDSPSIGGGWGEAAFLTTDKINAFSKLNTLFFQILAQTADKRPAYLQEFTKVPYLNSSLFEETEQEKVLKISALPNDVRLPMYEKSVLTGKANDALDYLLQFLNAYNFSGIQDVGENPDKLISAAVLGLIFEKINGYKDGSFFTPSFITMYMCRETIGRAVVQKFNDAKGWNCQTINDVHNHIGKNTEDIKEANRIFNTLRICDPAVGSGHFLVSALNEMIYLKSELGILADENFKTLNAYQIEIENDELTIKYNGEHFRYQPKNAESQRIQKTFFHEKQTIIENCLFGVDINPNSVKICQLRLWIELLKHAYYLDFKHADNADETDLRRLEEKNPCKSIQSASSACQNLQTLPNIDINIKCGNSLISRFDLADKYLNYAALQQKVKQATKKYKEWVSLYKTTHNKEAKRQIVKNIETEKAIFYQINNARDADYKNLQKLRNDLALHTQGFDFFAQTDEWSAKTTDLSEKIQKLEAAYNEKIRGCFEWRFEFPEVLDYDGNFTGFDVVIGNPPYGVLFSNTERNYFKHNYKTSVWRGESYLFFIERGLNLLKKSGLLNLIIPDTLLNLGFTQSSRELLLQNSKLKEVVGLPSNVFAAATVDTIILLTEKANFTNQFHSVNVNVKTFGKKHAIASIKEPPKEFTADSKDWFEQKAFNLQADNTESILLSKIEKSSNTISDIAEMFSGIKSYEVGKGKPAQTKKIKDEKPYTSEIQIDKSWQPFFDGKHIGRYQLLWKNNNWIKYGQWLAAPRDPENFEGEKILIRKITGKTLLATYIPDTSYCNTLLFVLKLKDKDYAYKSILGVLNSNLIGWYFRKKFQINDDDTFPQIMIRDIMQFPIPKITYEQQQPIIALVNQILSAKQEKPDADTAELEREIDGLVYGLYGLTEEEIGIIENKR